MNLETKCNKIIEIVTNYYNVDILNPENLKNKERKIVFPRQVAQYLIDKHLKTTLKYNAGFFKKDHATVLNSRKVVNSFLYYDKQVKEEINDIENIIHLNLSLNKKQEKEMFIFRIAEKLRNKDIEKVANINKILSY